MAMRKFGLAGLIISILLFVSCKQEVYFNITTKVQPENGGSIIVTPSSGAVLEGTSLTFKANPNSEYVFTGWSGGLSGTENPKTIIASSDLNVVANFTLKSYPLSLSVEGDGAINERVISTKTDYSSGTVVELTANPSTGWSFDHWEGDITSTDNPIQITISSAKTVKAVFTKNKYAYNLKIVGPGVVDEYLLPETKADFDYGTVIRLNAYPDVTKRAKFKGWSGDISADDTEVTVCLDRNLNIIATFATETKQYPLPNLLLPTSVRKDIFYEADFPNTYCCEYCALDYNQDGYVDIVTCYNTGEINTRNHIQFYLGQPDGSFQKDAVNSDRFDGLICWRKSLYGDFNGDNVPDICFVGHGWDAEPWPGEYPVMLLSSSDGRYEETRFTEIVGYFHGSAAGDFDNDGDLDVFLLDHGSNSWFLMNDGKGVFTPDNTLHNKDLLAGSVYTTELYDLNHDGFLDLIVGGHEHEGPDWHQYTFPSFVFWGNGKTFNNDNYGRFPRFDTGWGVTLDYIFEDLDGDGYEEIINCRTGDGFGRESYLGWAIQIVSFDGSSFKDVTRQYIDKIEGYEAHATWLVKIGIEEIDSTKYLIGLNCSGGKQKLFSINGNKFSRCEEENARPLKYTNGICFYSDGFGKGGDYASLDCQDDPFSGTTCIRMTNWPTWTGWTFDYEDWIDFSELEKQGYVLEFAIKNSDPDMLIAFAFETRLQTDPWYFPAYNYTYLASEHKCDGTWELVRVPLSEMTCDPEWTGYYWNTIKTLNIMPWVCHGKELYLDEIRIRKVLPE